MDESSYEASYNLSTVRKVNTKKHSNTNSVIKSIQNEVVSLKNTVIQMETVTSELKGQINSKMNVDELVQNEKFMALIDEKVNEIVEKKIKAINDQINSKLNSYYRMNK